MQFKLIFVRANNTSFEETNLLSFSLTKDAYTPYSLLSAVCASSDESYDAICEVKLYTGSRLIHHGYVDTADYCTENGKPEFKIVSKSFTSLLLQNQLEPGLKTGVSINSLMDDFYTLPYITHENNSDTSNYIYVKNGSSMWDGIVNLSYKLYGTYPYISGTNCVRITPKENPFEYTFTDNMLIKSGMRMNYKRLISNFNMADINGDYGQYTFEDRGVLINKIVRHICFELDKQFLNSPQEALVYRDRFSSRAGVMYYCKYSGYLNEDLFDYVSFGSVDNERIGYINITGGADGVFTELGVYRDKFFQQQ